MTIFGYLATVNFLIYSILVLSAIPSGNSATVGSKCSLSAGRIAGVCTNVKNCGYAISNYIAGISPTLCSPIKDGIAIEDTHKCGIAPTAYITSGRNAKPDEFPYMAALGYGELKEKSWKCGGTIISDEFVLTAAHCVNTTFGKPRRVIVGSLYLQDPRSTRRKTLVAVKETIIYPTYQRPLRYNDIALLRLAKKLPLSKTILPACLPQPHIRPDNVKMGRITGWGFVKAIANQNSNILQAATIARFNQSACNEVFLKKPDRNYGYPKGIIRSQFCAGDQVMDTCNGDSGGPFVIKHGNNDCQNFVVGITSFGPVFCGYGEPGVYTNVQSYIDWIESIVWPEGN
ncbi:unnamed protein product [Allacma fusca]|uniref:Peptidase S1 domain-containing protein n=1 Tax=Allacma fusca TaxID=39272 RepID=A0A8J2Q279_9HEXA|nr:unnamed protein product [Allacma fusca]